VTLVEFLAPLKKLSAGRKVLAVLYYKKRYEDVDAMTVEQVRSALVAARVPKAKTMNVADLLSKSGASVDSPRAERGRRLWAITDTGEREVRRFLDLPEAEPEVDADVASLTKVIAKVRDANARDFLLEAVTCLRFGARRAAVVFAWSAAITVLREKVWKSGVVKVNAALKSHDPKAREVKKVDDFAFVKDTRLLEVLYDLGIVDKTEKTMLGQALELRNGCGHPTKYRPSKNKVSSYIDDVVGIVF
jgi:hypothetical protein